MTVLVLALAVAGSNAVGAPPLASAAVSVAAPTSIDCPELKGRLRSPERFLAGLVGSLVPVEARHCLYMIPSRMSRPAPIYRIAPGAALRGPVWSPTRPELAVAHRVGRGFEVALLDTNGRMLRRFSGRDAAFFRDGRMLLRQRDQLWLVSDGRKKLLVGRDELQRAAGFPVTGYDLSSTDGYGRAGVIVSVWGSLRSRLLLVTVDGAPRRVSPIYKADAEGESMPGPAAWSPDGRVLLIPWQHNHPTNAASHEHCLARWTVNRGYRVTLCRNPHFHRILWHPDGGIALLNNGLIVARDGTVRARLRIVGRGMSVRWKQLPLADVG
jgi:hypothetical protein